MLLKLTSSFSRSITRPLRQVSIGNLKAKRAFIKSKKNIRESGLFDKEYYLSTNPDVKGSSIDPLKHFIHFGGFEGRNPNPDFDTNYYSSTNVDVKESGINPLLHYIKFGKPKTDQ